MIQATKEEEEKGEEKAPKRLRGKESPEWTLCSYNDTLAFFGGR